MTWEIKDDSTVKAMEIFGINHEHFFSGYFTCIFYTEYWFDTIYDKQVHTCHIWLSENIQEDNQQISYEKYAWLSTFHLFWWTVSYAKWYWYIWELRHGLASGFVIVSHRILWDAITYPCLRYLLLAPKSLSYTFTEHLKKSAHCLPFLVFSCCLASGFVIVSHRILWDAITYPCLRYLLLAPKSLSYTFTEHLKKSAHCLPFLVFSCCLVPVYLSCIIQIISLTPIL